MADFFNFDARIISDLQSLTNDLPSDFNFASILETSIQILEGRTFEVPEISGLTSQSIMTISRASSALFWECAKNAPRDPSIIDSILSKVGLSENYVSQFCRAFREGKVRLADIKWDLGISRNRFHDLSWRLDIELARRTVTEMCEPKFMLRLDLSPPNSSLPSASPSPSPSDSLISHHLQCDLASMRHLQAQLTLALSEMNGIHSQRIQRYIT